MRRTGLLAAVLIGAAAPPDAVSPLLDQLRSAPTGEQAAALEQKIASAWRARITPSVQLLEDRAVQSLQKHDAATAIGDLDAALDLQPDQAELWRLHAEARFSGGDETGAFADLAQALSREPRCFPALADLSHFAEARHDYGRALGAWQKLLEIDPRVRQGEARLAALQRKVSGQPL